MTGLQYLKLDKTSLKEIPEEMGKLAKLVRNFSKFPRLFSLLIVFP